MDIKNTIDKVTNRLKKNKKITITIFVIMIFIITILISYLQMNHNKFEALNKIRPDLYLKEYDSNNIFIKNQTLKEMQNDIEDQFEHLKKEYIKQFNPSQDIITKIEKIANNTKLSIEEKEKQIIDILKSDLESNIKKLSDDYNNIINKDINYSDEENSQLKTLNDKYKELIKEKKSLNLEDMYNKYNNIYNNNMKIKQLQSKANKRIKAEKAKLEQLAKEQLAEEQKQKEEQKENAKSSNDDSNSSANSDSNNSSDSSSSDGPYNRALAMSLFNAINAYRTSLGLPKYSYSSRQSCVDREAKAYADTNNPHNWVCTSAANENASYTAIGSDMVGITMDFFKNDPPHEAPMSGNYSSMAVSVYQKNNMNYTIVDFFN